MSFFQTSDGKALNSDGTFEMGGDDFPPIPKGTQVLASIFQAKWTSWENDPEYIDLGWSIIQPAEYANRKIFQKIRVNDPETDVKDKAMRMLAAIDSNAGGKLQAAGVAPTAESMTLALANRPMVLKLAVWELDKDRDGNIIPKEDRKSGNWVQQVAPYNQQASAAPANPMASAQPAPPQPQQPVQQVAQPQAMPNMDSSIPF